MARARSWPRIVAVTEDSCLSRRIAVTNAKSSLDADFKSIMEYDIVPVSLVEEESTPSLPGGQGLVSTNCCTQFWSSKKNLKSTQFVELYFGV